MVYLWLVHATHMTAYKPSGKREVVGDVVFSCQSAVFQDVVLATAKSVIEYSPCNEIGGEAYLYRINSLGTGNPMVALLLPNR